MNRFIETVDFERASVPMRSRVKILYMTQASVAPRRLCSSPIAGELHFSYQRFLENQIRAAFGFLGDADLDQESGEDLSSAAYGVAASICAGSSEG